MQLQRLIGIVLVSTILTACGDDISRNNRNPITRTTTGLSGESGVISGAHRERGIAPITYSTEIANDWENINIHAIADIRFDDDGADGKNVSTRTAKGRPTVICGITKVSLKEKISDCSSASKNATKATWSGTLEAGSSEGTWNLVTLAEKDSGDDTYEVWLDKRTNMVWSDIVVNEANWCGASGSQNEVSDNVGEDCLNTGNGKSFCTNLHLAELPIVKWRLPTRHDYLQADLDGIRFVLKQNSGALTFWTATTSTDVVKRDKAWTYDMTNGKLASEAMNSKRHVRCIGTPNF